MTGGRCRTLISSNRIDGHREKLPDMERVNVEEMVEGRGIRAHPEDIRLAIPEPNGYPYEQDKHRKQDSSSYHLTVTFKKLAPIPLYPTKCHPGNLRSLEVSLPNIPSTLSKEPMTE